MKKIVLLSMIMFMSNILLADGTLDGVIGAGYGPAVSGVSIGDEPAGDDGPFNNVNLDIIDLYITQTASDVFIGITLNDDVSVTDWGQYLFYIETDNPSSGTATNGDGNGWARANIQPDDSSGINPSFWIGSWVNFGGGAELYQFDSSGPTWGSNIGGISLAIGAGTTSTLEYQISKASLGNPNTIEVSAISSGGGGSDSVIDVVPDGNEVVAGFAELVIVNSQTSAVTVPVELSIFSIE